MDNLIAWLGTPGLIIIGSLVILYFKKKKDAEDAE
ncbi:MAG: LPXTG cell wall anchor domain-containing protein [Paludibacter sp.]